jgi:hypothetical protein
VPIAVTRVDDNDGTIMVSSSHEVPTHDSLSETGHTSHGAGPSVADGEALDPGPWVRHPSNRNLSSDWKASSKESAFQSRGL